MSEKWNSKLYFRSDLEDKDEARKHEEAYKGNLDHQIYSFNELEKTDFERQTIASVVNAYDQLLEELDIPKIAINVDQIHILNEDELLANVTQDKNHKGKWAFGHAYIARSTNPAKFIHDLTHELSHKISYYAISIDQKRSDNNEITNNIQLARTGYFSAKRFKEGKKIFAGVSEVATEMFAHEARQIFLKNDQTLNDSQKHELEYTTAYYCNVFLVMELIKKVAINKDEQKELYMKLLKGHIYGDYSFFKDIKYRHKDINKIMAQMEATPDGALKAAEQLGLNEAVDEINTLKNTTYDFK
jgi:hypothetical protein